MTSIDKILNKMKRQPRGITFKEAERVLIYYGYTLVRSRGSHRYFRNDAGDLIMVKEKNPLKITYVNEILDRVGE
ncbi:type II toxin-antitoxin system HicA family toxin [Rossellomorea vietnamensis]|uniref:Type II toxin-antitoxin system HicA family toxin n=1 Tax=Rossellomorea vietnamensis TaxID=218284 RepID=A0A5D4NWI7_9BACI|nr:type II toxin-antitoxin system HicA family toxin [Rossellomorea vietnamensis]TYS17102.1 type II toxin-antitoxin system HicA family toxin [Rossellomorea vietnamensis]